MKTNNKNINGTAGDSKLPPAASPEITWQGVLEQVEREAKLRGNSIKSVGVTLSACKGFIAGRGFELEDPVAADFISELENKLASDDLTAYGITTVNTAYKSRLMAMVRSFNALANADFFKVLKEYLYKEPLISRASIEAQTGITRPQIRSWLVRQSPGVSNISVEQAEKLDGVLNAKGKLLAVFAATSQRAVYEMQTSILNQVLKREAFGLKLKKFRNQTGRTMDSIMAEVKTLSGKRLHKAQYSKWEANLYIPSEEMRPAIEALDKIYKTNRALLDAWEKEKVKKNFTPYAFHFRDWPQLLRDQFSQLVEYKTKNPEQWKTNNNNGGDRWTSQETIKRHEYFLAKFYGYLIAKNRVSKADLSITLLCHWPFVRGLLDFVAERVGKGNQFSTDAYTMVGSLLNLYRFYYPHLHTTAAKESFWRDKVQKYALKEERVTNSFINKSKIQLPNWQTRWEYHVSLTAAKAQDFLRTQKFEKNSLFNRAQPLLDEETSLRAIGKELEAKIMKLPANILTRKAAIVFRRLAMAAFVLARAPRTNTLSLLKINQIQIDEAGNILVNIPEAAFKQRGRGGSKGGMVGKLTEIPWINKILCRYLREARPFLLGEASAPGQVDAGFFFIASHSKKCRCRGGQLNNSLILHDTVLTLGYNPYAQRYLVASDAESNNISTQEVAAILMNTPEVTKKTYLITTPGRKNNKAVSRMTELLGGPAGSKVR